MSAQVITLPRRTAVTEHFGGCPYCGGNDGYHNIGRQHWFVCDRHQTKWLAGENLFSNWREEGADVWRRNEYRLTNFMEVTPVFEVPKTRGQNG